MTCYESLFYALTLWTALAAIIKGEAGYHLNACVLSILAAVCLFAALVLGN